MPAPTIKASAVSVTQEMTTAIVTVRDYRTGESKTVAMKVPATVARFGGFVMEPGNTYELTVTVEQQ